MDAINVRIARISVTNLRQRVYIRQNRFTSRSLHEKSRRELSRFYFKKKEKKNLQHSISEIRQRIEGRTTFTSQNVTCARSSRVQRVLLIRYLCMCMYVCMYVCICIVRNTPFLSCKVTCMCICKCTFIAYVQRAYVRRRNASLIAYNDDRDY